MKLVRRNFSIHSSRINLAIAISTLAALGLVSSSNLALAQSNAEQPAPTQPGSTSSQMSMAPSSSGPQVGQETFSSAAQACHRLVFALHAQCFVNSICHTEPTAALGEDSSRNVTWLAAMHLFQGENWHRNHHARPGSAQLGWTWRQPDLGYLTICLLEKIGGLPVRGGRVDAAGNFVQHFLLFFPAQTAGLQVSRRQSDRIGQYQPEPLAAAHGGRVCRRERRGQRSDQASSPGHQID